MVSPAMKKVRILDEDRISSLPDDLIHKILSFLDAELAVQTSVLSKRWKFIWTPLPFLNFGWYQRSTTHNKYKFVQDFFNKRNDESNVLEFKLYVFNTRFPVPFLEKQFAYAIHHNVQCLNINLANVKPYKLSAFRSDSIRKLTLQLKFDECASESDCWNLPALTNLCLRSLYYMDENSMDVNPKLSDLCITCLPALRTLGIDHWDLSKSSFSFSLPALTTLHLCKCRLPTIVWNFPALKTVDLYDVSPPEYMSGIFSALVNLQNLTIYLTRLDNYLISCPQLKNLNIRARFCLYCNIEVFAPKLCSFTSAGIYRITFKVPSLENVNIKLQGFFKDNQTLESVIKKEYNYGRFLTMLRGLGNAKNLSFDLECIQALSAISEHLASFPSPFNNLNCVKLPPGYQESSISRALKNYLLGNSRGATIVTTSPQIVNEFILFDN